jgi:hypothetical protein
MTRLHFLKIATDFSNEKLEERILKKSYLDNAIVFFYNFSFEE